MNAAVAPINIALFVCVHASVKLCVVSLCLSFKLCKLGASHLGSEKRAESNEGCNGAIVGISIPQRGERGEYS